MCIAQTNITEADSSKVDSLTIMLEKLAREWNPDDEVWTFISFELEKLELKVKYGQQAIHPFMAEYNRKIQFETKTSKTDTIDMHLNWGGRTYIEIFYDKAKDLILMEDQFGRYFLDLTTFEYSEKLEDFSKYDNKLYLGRINGKEYPLKFEVKE